MLTTRIPRSSLWSTANWRPRMTSSTLVAPWSSETFTETRLASGAVPGVAAVERVADGRG